MMIGSFEDASQQTIPSGTTRVRTTDGADYVEFNEGSANANDAWIAAHTRLAFKSANNRYFRLSLEQTLWSWMAGIVANSPSTSENHARLEALIKYGYGRTIHFPAGEFWFEGSVSANGYPISLEGEAGTYGIETGFWTTVFRFNPSAEGQWLIDRFEMVDNPPTSYSEVSVTVSRIGFKFAENMTIQKCGFVRLGRRDENGDGNDDLLVDAGGQRYQMGHRFHQCGFLGPYFERNATNLDVALGGRILVDLAKCFETVFEACTFNGGDIQFRTYGCDHPQLRGCRMNYGCVPIWVQVSGSFNVQHVLEHNQIESWGYAAIVNWGVSLHLVGRAEQNIYDPASGRDIQVYDITASDNIVASVTAGSKTATFTAGGSPVNMENKVVPHLTVLTFLRGWEAYAVSEVTAGGTGHAVGDLVTFPDGVKVRVTAVNGGAIQYAQVLENGNASAASAMPSGPGSQGATTGSGTGAQLKFEWRAGDSVSALVAAVNGNTVTLMASSATDTEVPYGGEEVLIPWTIANCRVERVQGAFLICRTNIDCYVSVNGMPNNAPFLIWTGGRSRVVCVGCGGSGQNHFGGRLQSMLLPNQASSSASYSQAGVTFVGCHPKIVADPGHPRVTVLDNSSQRSTAGSGMRHVQIEGVDGRYGSRRRWRFAPKSYSTFTNYNTRILMRRVPDPEAGDGYRWCWVLDGTGDIVPGVRLSTYFGLYDTTLPKTGYLKIRAVVAPSVPGVSGLTLAPYGRSPILDTSPLPAGFTVLESLCVVPPQFADVSEINGSTFLAMPKNSPVYLACVDVEEISQAEARNTPKGTKNFPVAFGNVGTGPQSTSGELVFPGAEVGDRVEINPGGSLKGVRVWGEVTSFERVTIYAANHTGANADLGTLNYGVTVYWNV